MRQVAFVAAVLATATLARAQECAEGRERSAGFCCWPGQTFSTSARRCEGPPHCPAGRVEHGESCVLPRRPTVAQTEPSSPTERTGERLPPMPAGYAPLAPEPPPSTTTDESWPVYRESGELHRAAMVRGRDEGLITFALVLFDAGWVFGWAGVVLDEATRGCGGSCQSWPLAFVPLAGGTAASVANFSSRFRTTAFGIGFGITSGLLQAIGLIAAAIAVENRTTELALPEVSAGDVSVTLVPGAPDALAGFSLAGTF